MFKFWQRFGNEILYDITDSKKEETTDGILDADVDFEQDNFTMLEEYQNDTDPINPDTDGDGLLDGDELLVGLNPLNPSTFGYSDAEYLVELEVEENSDLVSCFNNNNSELEKHETKYNDNHFNGIPYHFVINGSGTIYQGRPINYKGSHVAKNNTGKIGICLMGNFQSDNNGFKQIIKSALPTTPTNSQYEAMEELIKVLETQYYTQYSGGHKDFVVEGNSTVCPGNNCYTMLQDDGYIKLP